MNDLETRLSAAGRSLRESAERTTDPDAGWADLTARIAAESDGAVVVQADDRFDQPPVQRHRWLAAAAAIVVVIGAAATFVALTDPTDPPVASGGPLFLLPEPGSGYEVSSGSVETLDAEVPEDTTSSFEAVAYGIRTGDGYRDPVVVRLYLGDMSSLAEIDGVELERRVVETASGPAFVESQGSFFTRIVQQRAGAWLEILLLSSAASESAISTAATTSEEQATALIGAVAIVDGSIVVERPPGGLVEIARERVSMLAPAASVSFQVSGRGIVAGDDGTLATVDTADWPTSIVVLAASTSNFIEPFTVDGHDGWHATRPDGWRALAWRADSGQMVGVSGDEDLEALLQLAESLVPVDEATWRTATGAGPAPTTTTNTEP